MISLDYNLEESFNEPLIICDKYVKINESLSFHRCFFSRVYRGYLKADPTLKIAVREIYYESNLTPKFIQNLEREINILKRLNHPNIVKLYDVFRLPDRFLIFSEMCEEGNLQDLINAQNKKSLPEEQVLLIMSQIVDAFKVLYENQVTHRELKPTNIFIQKNMYKISVFGPAFAREIQEVPKIYEWRSPLYSCPQILKSIIKSTSFSSKCDVWSLGKFLTKYTIFFLQFY